MKKKFLSYLILSTIILVSLFAGVFIIRAVRAGQTYTDIMLTDNLSEVIIEEANFNYSETLIDTRNYNSTISVSEILSFESTGFIALGSRENSTNHEHGFIEIYSISGTHDSISIDLTDSYVDDNGINETDYLKAHSFDKTLDGYDTSETIALLKSIDSSVYVIDFFQFNVNTINFNTTFICPSALIETVYDFEFTDVDGDSIAELYLLGSNNSETENVLLEFTYNDLSNSFDLNKEYGWIKGSSLVVDIKHFHETTELYFVVTNLFTAVPIKTNVIVISLEKNPIRNFALESNLTLDYNTDIFRAYSAELFSTNIVGQQGLALFGTYIENGLDNYPICIRYTITNGIALNTSFYRIEQTPDWSLDGLAVDIDLDGVDEIIMTTYDLLAETLSDYHSITSSGMEVFDSGLTSLRRIRGSTLFTFNNLQVGIFLGKDHFSRDILTYSSLHYIPYKVNSIGEILYQNELNNFTIETTSLTGQVINREDISMEFGIQDDSDSSQTINSFPANVSLDVDALTTGLEMQDISINVTKDTNTIHEITKELIVDYKPEFSVKIPQNLIVIRNTESVTVPIEITIDNKLSQLLETHIVIRNSFTSTVRTLDGYTSQGDSDTFTIDISFVGPVPPEKYIDEVTFTFETNYGVFTKTIPVDVTNKFGLIQSDIIVLLSIAFVAILCGYIGFGISIHRTTKQEIANHYTTGKPMKIEFPNFKTRAYDSLIKDLIESENWEIGIKIAQDLESPYLFSFIKYKIRANLKEGQELLKQGKFEAALEKWENARVALDEIGTHEQIDTMEWLLSPLRNIVKVVTQKKGTERATLLQKEFENLNDLRELHKIIFNIVLEIPLYLVAEELGLAMRDSEELQSSLNYLQFAYQSAPTEEKNRIVSEITGLISLGVTPTEFSLPVDHEEIRERISKRTIRCFSCGEERTNVNEPCSNCGVETVQCSVCKLPISFGSDYLECSHCQNVAHREHLLEWVKVKGTCPICQQKLTVDDFTVVQEKA
ncbi:MAG: hypothetical protein FK733_18570 [Asgard group archaeon]|nr:hypothetical protein [Asgard group archaeon]